MTLRTGRRVVQLKNIRPVFLRVFKLILPFLSLMIARNKQCFLVHHILPQKNRNLAFSLFLIKNRPLKSVLLYNANNFSLHFVGFFIKITCISLREEYIIYTALRAATKLPYKAVICLLLNQEKPDMVEVDTTYLWQTQRRVDARVLWTSVPVSRPSKHNSAA